MAQCPKCGKKVFEYSKSYSCESGKDGCGFVIWKTVAGKSVSLAQAEKILSDDAANVYLMDPNDLTVISKKLGGYIFYPLFVIDLAKIYYK